MKEYTVVVAPELSRTRILVKAHKQELLRAILPPIQSNTSEAMSKLLEGIARWLEHPLCVVFAVDEQVPLYSSRIVEDLIAQGPLFYEVGIAAAKPRPKRYRQTMRFYDLQGYGKYQT